VTAAPAPTATTEAPKLLLDTNVDLDLADGRLASVEGPLMKLAAHRTPPLFWGCEIVFDELVCRMRPDDQADFERHQAALRWMEKLCGGRGMTEDQKWILRRGVFQRAAPCDGKLAAAIVHVRREILAAKSYGDLDPVLRQKIDELRADYRRRIDAWVARRSEVGHAARAPLQPGDAGVRAAVAAAAAVLEISRKHASEHTAVWGAFRSDEDQQRAQRELIAFEVSYLQKARGAQPYNHEKHRSDYNDYWLCAYCAAGYTIVTTDGRLRSAVRDGGCSDPRIVSLDEGIALAESWLAGR
jgi:hypothetical protein